MLALVAATPESPGEVWVQCLEYERQITRLMADALGDVELFRPEARRFRAPDRVDLFGWVLRDPAAPVPGPLLLDIHGGPHNAWAPVFDGVDLHHQMLAAAGWTVLLVNPRGSDGYGEEFYRGVTGAWGRADLDDFLVATCGLVAEGVADPKRLAVSGYSYGGYMTCWLTSQTDWFTSAVAGGCVTDLAGFVGATDVGPRAAVELGGPPHEHAARYADLSPMTHVAEVATPTLLLHGEADLRCPIDQADRWFAALRRLGQTVELVRYPGADHLFVVTGRPSHRVDYCRRLVDWVVTHDGPRVPVAYRQGRHTR
jgi:dipeptidyl aminopeptidase/acylaminoacyl peptidase